MADIDHATHQEKIRRRAYELWERAGKPEGQDDAFWQQAEEAERQAGKPGANADIDRAIDESFPASDPVNRT